MERSKDITHVKLLPSLVAKISDICELMSIVSLLFTCKIHDTTTHNSAFVLFKLVKLSQVFKIMFST